MTKEDRTMIDFDEEISRSSPVWKWRTSEKPS